MNHADILMEIMQLTETHPLNMFNYLCAENIGEFAFLLNMKNLCAEFSSQLIV